MDSQLVFSSTGSVGDMQLVSGLVYRGHTADVVVGMVGWPGSTETLHQSPTQDVQFHHLRAHSSTENIPRDCVSCQVSSDLGLETATL